jgi:hypothetical protein
MKIIAVNISKTLLVEKSCFEATQNSWRLNLNSCKKFDYVIGVSKGYIECHYKLKDVHQDKVDFNRVDFDLVRCTSEEEKSINEFIKLKGIKLSRFVTKYII